MWGKTKQYVHGHIQNIFLNLLYYKVKYGIKGIPAYFWVV